MILGGCENRKYFLIFRFIECIFRFLHCLIFYKWYNDISKGCYFLSYCCAACYKRQPARKEAEPFTHCDSAGEGLSERAFFVSFVCILKNALCKITERVFYACFRIFCFIFPAFTHIP